MTPKAEVRAAASAHPAAPGEGGDLIITVILAAATAAARAEGLDQRSATRLAASITDRLRRELGTARVYIPAPSRAARDRAILAGLAQGDSRQAIAARIGVHVTTVDRVARRHQGARQRAGMGPAEWVL